MTNPTDIIRLVSLGAIWGGSFIFMRILAPVLAPIVTTDSRILLGAGAIGLFCLINKESLEWRKNWLHYCVVGLTNSAIPFYLFAFAAIHISAGYSAIFNSTTPFFGAIFSALWLNERLTAKKIAGLLLGICGVTFVSQAGVVAMSPMGTVAVIFCLGASLSLSLGAIYIKKFAIHIPPLSLVRGSLLFTGILLSPALFLYTPEAQKINFAVVASILGLGLMCTAIAYVMYYRLINDVGPTKATTVNFLVPIFCLLWASIFLGECVTGPMLIGCGLIVSGTYLVIKA